MASKRKEQTKSKTRLITDNLQVPGTVERKTAFIELVGNNEVSIEGCKGVLEYNDEEIKLNIGKNEIKFIGTDLEIKSYINDEICINGIIMTIEFS